MSTLMNSSLSLPNSFSINNNGASFLPLRFFSIGSIFASPKLNEFHLSKLSVGPKMSAVVGPVRAGIREQSSPDYVPDAELFKVEAILRPWKVLPVSSALLAIGICGVTVSEVKGFGAQGGLKEYRAVTEFSEANFAAKVKMEIVVKKDQVEAVTDKIISEAWTGEVGDGKIFVIPVSDIIRVRTGERGDKAVRMAGARAEMPN